MAVEAGAELVSSASASTPALAGRASGSGTGALALLRRLARSRAAVAGALVVALFVLTALFSPWLQPYTAEEGDLIEKLLRPGPRHLLGTDELGRDILSRLIAGATISLQIQVVAVGLALVVGGAIGLAAGYAGGLTDDLLMRAMDVLLAFPGIFLAIAVVAALGTGIGNVMLAVGISLIPQFARLLRGSTLSIKEKEYIEAARAIGQSHPQIVVRHVLPNCIAPVIVQTTLRMATVLLTASGLSFLGLGVQPPTPEWGAMLSNSRDYMLSSPHAATIPGLAIMLAVLGFNLLGDGLRDSLDPRLRT